MYDVIIKLSEKYKNLPVTMFIVGHAPLVSMRFTGDEKQDSIFKNKEFFICDAKKNYSNGIIQLNNAKLLFKINQNFRIYNLYYNSLKTCIGCNNFENNMQKYPNNLFGIKINKPMDIKNTRGVIIKYRDYYYMLSIYNIMSSELSRQNGDISGKQERHILWKKMTESQLMKYSSGSYWKMISVNNMRF
jgi:hypothetical protein